MQFLLTFCTPLCGSSACGHGGRGVHMAQVFVLAAEIFQKVGVGWGRLAALCDLLAFAGYGYGFAAGCGFGWRCGVVFFVLQVELFFVLCFLGSGWGIVL